MGHSKKSSFQRDARQGGILPFVIVILFILITVTAALHTSQTRAVRKVTQATADLQFHQASEFAAAEIIGNPQPLPDWLDVTTSVDKESNEDRELKPSYSSELWNELPNLNPKDEEYAPGHYSYKIFPKTNDAGLKVHGGRHLWLVAHQSAGYAAYAPKGTIKLGETVGWANPTFEDTRKVKEAFSGVPTDIAGLGNIEVEELRYGSAFTKDGEIDLGSDSQGVGFKGYFPHQNYETKLKTTLDKTRDDFYLYAASGDKTPQLTGGVLQTAGTMVKMLFGGSGEPSLSLEQAWGIPFPMIPGFAMTVPGIFYEFWFHMPYAPDFQNFNSVKPEEATEQAKQVKKLKDEIDDLEKAIAAKRRELNNETSESKKKKLQKELNKLKDDKRDKEKELKKLEKEIKKRSDKARDEVKNKSGSKPPDGPETRAQDKNLSKKGSLGWAYSPLLDNMLNLLTSIISGDGEKIAESFVNKVRIVHYGDKDEVPEFRFNDGLYAKSTWTVPPGRTFRYRGNMQVEGDVWLQKGSLMAIDGNLTLSNPNPSNNPLKPAGKLVMEEGSTLVVKGDLALDGTSKYGSLWTCSKPGLLSPVSTAILVEGTVNIPYGSFSATTLADAADWLAKEYGGPSEIKDGIQILMNDVAPNLSKIAGPFHTRKPFFARYAATFQLTIVPTPVGPVPIPTPIPLPRKNVLVPVFRAFTLIYSPAMNYSLGENLYTQADWWAFGDGVVPAIIKVHPEPLLRSIKKINLSSLSPNIDWEDELKSLSEDLLKEGMKFAVEEVGRALVKQVISAAIPFGSIVAEVADQIVDAVDTRGDRLEELAKKAVQRSIEPIVGKLRSWADDLKNLVEDQLSEAYLREITGPLIYAKSILVDDGRLMAGMLVAEETLNVGSARFVGSLTSFEGNISANTFYFTPQFTRASLYKPKATKSNWLERGLQYEYGDKFDSKTAVDVNTVLWEISTESWNR